MATSNCYWLIFGASIHVYFKARARVGEKLFFRALIGGLDAVIDDLVVIRAVSVVFIRHFLKLLRVSGFIKFSGPLEAGDGIFAIRVALGGLAVSFPNTSADCLRIGYLLFPFFDGLDATPNNPVLVGGIDFLRHGPGRREKEKSGEQKSVRHGQFLFLGRTVSGLIHFPFLMTSK